MYHTTVPFNVIVDSGRSAESGAFISLLLSCCCHFIEARICVAIDFLCISEYSLELGSSVSAFPEGVCTSPGFVAAPEHMETPSPVPRAPTTDTVSPDTADSTPEHHHDSEGPSGQPGSTQHSKPNFNIEELPEPSSPAGVSTSLDRVTASDACDVNSTGSSQSNAVIFWTRCNQAGWTEEIFSELVSQLGSLGKRVQSQEASHQGEMLTAFVAYYHKHLLLLVAPLKKSIHLQVNTVISDIKTFISIV